MNYEVFPFGKYKGIPISNLPTTYLAYALESFELPEELKAKMVFMFLHRIQFDLESHTISDSDVVDVLREIYDEFFLKEKKNASLSDLYYAFRDSLRKRF